MITNNQRENKNKKPKEIVQKKQSFEEKKDLISSNGL
jgi:hypothetical protein